MDTRAGLLRFGQYGDGARVSTRFNVEKYEALKTPSPLGLFTLRPRERRAPLTLGRCHPVLMCVDVRSKGETVWPTQPLMMELFQTTQQAIYAEGEWSAAQLTRNPCQFARKALTLACAFLFDIP